MKSEDNILELVTQETAEAHKRTRRGLIIQPGALGDCILTLPLVQYMKKYLDLDSIDILGHTEYIGILPERTCVDGVRSIDAIDLHRLFTDAAKFDLTDGDPLVNVFADYTWIVTFLGEPGSDFEQNLIFTTHCSHNAEVTALQLKPHDNTSEHIAHYYIQQLAVDAGIDASDNIPTIEQRWIETIEADTETEQQLLNEMDDAFNQSLTVIAPGSGGLEKCWNIDNFLAVAEELKHKGFKVVFLLGPVEAERFDKEKIQRLTAVADCLTDLPLAHVVGLLTRTELFIGNDSGITHLAATMGIETIAVFGPTNPMLYGPMGPKVTTFSSDTADFTQKPSTELQRNVLEAATS
jgi:ADP-heptose:LPS heptosyltransferase